MQIYINKDNQQLGPFDEEKVKEMLAKGEVYKNNLCIREGDTNWQPLEVFYPNIGYKDSSGGSGWSFLTFFGVFLGIISFLVVVYNGYNYFENSRYRDFHAIVFLIALGFSVFFLLVTVFGMLMSRRAKRKSQAIIK
jgi:GYF domain 2